MVNTSIFGDIVAERVRQNEKWGVQRHPFTFWGVILGEEMGEVCKAIVELEAAALMDDTLIMESYTKELRTELVQTAAVAIQIIEHIDELAVNRE